MRYWRGRAGLRASAKVGEVVVAVEVAEMNRFVNSKISLCVPNTRVWSPQDTGEVVRDLEDVLVERVRAREALGAGAEIVPRARRAADLDAREDVAGIVAVLADGRAADARFVEGVRAEDAVELRDRRVGLVGEEVDRCSGSRSGVVVRSLDDVVGRAST